MRNQENFGMNENRGGGLLNRMSELVEEILRTLPRPLTNDVTDDVLYAIENSSRWRTQFDELCSEFSKCPSGHFVSRTNRLGAVAS